jgi:hypothetical protein
VSQIFGRRAGAPEAVEAILGGRQPADMQMGYLIKGFPLDWEGRRFHVD